MHTIQIPRCKYMICALYNSVSKKKTIEIRHKPDILCKMTEKKENKFYSIHTYISTMSKELKVSDFFV